MTLFLKTWLFGRLPVLIFVTTALAWVVFLAYVVATRPAYPTYPDIGSIFAIIGCTIIGGLVSFLLSAYGLRSPEVPRRWAWTGLLLNSPVVLYLVGYYPAVFFYRFFVAQ